MSTAAAASACILLVVTSAELGGAERMVLDLLRGMPTDQHRFHVLLPREGRLIRELDKLCVAYTVLPFGSRLSKTGRADLRKGAARVVVHAVADVVAYLWRYTQLVRRLRPKLVYTHGLKAEILTGLAAHWVRSPLVWHLHSFIPQHGWLGRGHRWLQRRTRLLIANSAAVAAGTSPASRQRTRVVYCGVDEQAFAPRPLSSALQDLGLPSDPPLLRVGMISVLAPWKGLDLFLRAVQPLLLADPQWQALIVGDPLYDTDGHAGYDLALQNLSRELGIATRVRFLPYQFDPAPAFACLDIFVHASKTPEPFGRVIAEAMSTQRAVIVSAGGGALEQVVDGVDGVVVPMDDEAALRVALAELMADPQRRRQLGLAARAKLLKQGTMHLFIENMAQAFAAALPGDPSATPPSAAPGRRAA